MKINSRLCHFQHEVSSDSFFVYLSCLFSSLWIFTAIYDNNYNDKYNDNYDDNKHENDNNDRVGILFINLNKFFYLLHLVLIQLETIASKSG